jgi:polyisoprenoid-binding protein YceI
LDEHLRSEDFFDVAAFPQITFESTAVERTGPGMGKITGDLTIKGRTHPVTLDAKLNRAAYDERGGVHKIGFSATTRLKRADFDVDLYAPFVSDEVDVIIEAEFVSETAE